MCGIAGAYDPLGRVGLSRLRRMSELMRHRGPEDEGIALFDARGGRTLVLGGPDTREDVYASGLSYTPGRGRTETKGTSTGLAVHAGLVPRRLAFLALRPAGHRP